MHVKDEKRGKKIRLRFLLFEANLEESDNGNLVILDEGLGNFHGVQSLMMQ